MGVQIMPNKLTDAEVKKALEWHLNEVNHCDGCPLLVLKNTTTYCVDVLMQNALDLINRQDQENESLKAEVERLKTERDKEHDYCNHYMIQCVKAKTKAYKECIEKVKEEMSIWSFDFSYYSDRTEAQKSLDNLWNEFERKESTIYDD